MAAAGCAGLGLPCGGAAGCTLLLLLIPLSRFDFFFGFPGSALAALPGFCLSLWLGDRLMEWYALPGTRCRFRWSFLLLTAPWVLFLPPVTILLPPPMG